MDADRYSISHLVDDLKRITTKSKNERDILAQTRPVARRAALSNAVWLEDRMYQADPDQGFGVHLLHENPDHTLAVFAVSWLPNRGTLPHNHGTWAVVAGVDGPEKNKFFKRLDNGGRPGHADLKKVGEKTCGVGAFWRCRMASSIACGTKPMR